MDWPQVTWKSELGTHVNRPLERRTFYIAVIGGQTLSGIPKGAEMNLALNNQNRLLFIQSQELYLSMYHYWQEMIEVVYKPTNGKS